jgi:hypothetical protein
VVLLTKHTNAESYKRFLRAIAGQSVCEAARELAVLPDDVRSHLYMLSARYQMPLAGVLRFNAVAETGGRSPTVSLEVMRSTGGPECAQYVLRQYLMAVA